ncbi:hypothetical protein [Pantoea anthophila]|uniref:hypothetical protein n=1 Tax=Pantoea anthophila TaxID=470931 RepID=UPI000ACD73F4|nr:hypothetical protein [Pantoea anthophila]
MRDLSRNEIEQVSGAGSTGPSAWAAKLTSVNKCIPLFNEILKLVNDLAGTKFSYLTQK